MKVSAEPMSAYAVYSEKLKQKKKKAKLHPSNGVSKVKKNADKKTSQMKEIGYILQKLAERSAEKSNPRATELLNNINEVNKKLEPNVQTSPGCLLKNITLIKNPKKKSLKDLNSKKVNKSLNSNESSSTNDVNTGNSIQIEENKSSDINNDAGTTIEQNKHSGIERKNTFSDLKRSKFEKNNVISNKEKNETVVNTSKPKKQYKFISKKQAKLISQSKLHMEQREHNIEVLFKNTGTTKQRKKSESNCLIAKKSFTQKSEVPTENKPGKVKSLKNHENSSTTAKQLFDWLILPISEKEFMRNYWEKKPLLIQREANRNYFSELLSTEVIDTVLRVNNVCFTKHLDVTSYTEGVRETHNLTGRAQANVVWDFYSNGCSVRLLNPQVFLPKIHTLNATLQEYFGCFVGANVYLTPPNSQGFAPHYDDIEAFVLQIEGKKHWKVYLPRNSKEVLPRFSSPNFTQDEIGDPFLDVTLEPGDLLYFPRGFIHQASTVEGEHSLHITLSAYQKTSWVDLLEKVLPIALNQATEDDVDFRKGLPMNYLGLEHHGSDKDKTSFVQTAHTLMAKLGHYLELSLGAGVDKMGAQFMHDALPPVLSPQEKQNSSVGGGLKLKNGKLEGRVEFKMDSCVKLIRYNICRLDVEQDELRLYHCLDNSLEYHGEEPQFLVLPPEGFHVITHLQTSYPAFVPIRSIPHEDEEALLTLISDLWDAGILSAEDLPVVNEEEDC